VLALQVNSLVLDEKSPRPMAQLLDPLPSRGPNDIVCCYVNATSKIQIARISNIQNWYFERVVFPGQRLVFEAVPEALLEIHCGMMASSILSDTIPCSQLCLQEAEHSFFPDPGSQQRIEEMNEGTVEVTPTEAHAEAVS